jgi:hypothetical protein
MVRGGGACERHLLAARRQALNADQHLETRDLLHSSTSRQTAVGRVNRHPESSCDGSGLQLVAESALPPCFSASQSWVGRHSLIPRAMAAQLDIATLASNRRPHIEYHQYLSPRLWPIRLDIEPRPQVHQFVGHFRIAQTFAYQIGDTSA